jgi:hypothetical protein
VSDVEVTGPDADDLPPVQALILEVLAARYRLGEGLWTFSTRHRAALKALEERGLVGWKPGIVYRTCLAWLTDEGRKAALSDTYKGPQAFTRDALVNALTRLELRVQLTGPIAGMINAESMADAIIEALGEGGRAA